jgi:hypothetical protein
MFAPEGSKPFRRIPWYILILIHTQTHTQTLSYHTHTLSHSHTHTYTHHTNTLSLTLTHIHTLSTHSLSLSHRKKIAKERHNRVRTAEEQNVRVSSLLKKVGGVGVVVLLF